MSDTWIVERTTGKHGQDWEIIFAGTLEPARQQYELERVLMYEGGLRLIGPSKEVITACQKRAGIVLAPGLGYLIRNIVS